MKLGSCIHLVQDGSRSFGLFRNGNFRIIAKSHRTGLIICSHSREGINLS